MMPTSVGILEMERERSCRVGARSYNLPPAKGAEATQGGFAVTCPTTTVVQRKNRRRNGHSQQVLLRV